MVDFPIHARCRSTDGFLIFIDTVKRSVNLHDITSNGLLFSLDGGDIRHHGLLLSLDYINVGADSLDFIQNDV